MTSSLRNLLASINEALLEVPREVLILKLSVLAFLLHGSSSWALDVPLRILCALLLLSNSLLRQPLLWLAAALIFVWVNCQQWYSIDNHKYLITFWCIACALSVVARSPLSLLQTNARWLIGLTFLFATSWKVAAGEYWDGRFLELTFLTDGRLMVPALLSGMKTEDLYLNYDVLDYLMAYPKPGLKASLLHGPQVGGTALALSYLTLLVEGLLALSFLLAAIPFFARIKDYLLIGFIAVTYFLLPVTGFGFTLSILGLAQCKEPEKRKVLAYLVCLLIVQFTLVPFDQLLLRFL